MNGILSRHAMSDSMQTELSKVVTDYFAQHSVSVHGCILMAMRCVEIYHERVVKVSSQGKREAVKELVPLILHEAVRQKFMSVEEAEGMQNAFMNIMPYVDSICTAFVTLSKSPGYLKLKKRAKASCGGKKQKLNNSEN